MNIELKNISKKYGKIDVVNRVNCSISNGVYGILGRNGAGKTTLFRMITGLIKPTSGDIIVKDNENIITGRKRDELIGYLPQDFGMYPNFKVTEVMEEIAILKNINKSTRKNKINSLLEKVNLLGEKKKKYCELSGGMKRRLGLAQAMLGTPRILIVDEPTAGVDPKERIYIRKILTEYAKNNIVILSTHLIEDIEHTCQELIILEKGNLLYSGQIDGLIQEASNYLGVKEFDNLDDFQEYSDKNTIFTFSRECNKIVTIVPKEYSDSKELNIKLEDAYMWKISKEGMQ